MLKTHNTCTHIHFILHVGRHGQIQLFYCNFDIKKEKKIYAHDMIRERISIYVLYILVFRI